MESGHCKYSCETRAQTLEWINAIVDFVKPYSFLINAQVVNFFKDRLWEVVDGEWMDCLRMEPVENLLLIPSGVVQDYWPDSLKGFIYTMRSLVFPREQSDLQKVLPNLRMTSPNTVLAQGMSLKKKHEVQVLSAVVSSVVNRVGACKIIDVGAGQGYLAQVLSFQYGHSVVAIDASPLHGKVTGARAERIEKHYAAQNRKSGSTTKSPNVPKTITCHLMSVDDMMKALTEISLHKDDNGVELNEQNEAFDRRSSHSLHYPNSQSQSSLVLSGLHACGDLSVTMLRTFLECEEVKAVVSIGCCYNLLSEERFDNCHSQYGFPMSSSVKSSGLSLAKNSRDLACQSAERWRHLGKDAGLQNFQLHAFRAAFQMVLTKYYPQVMVTSPSIGRQGKALRRQQQRRILESKTCQVENKNFLLAEKHSNTQGHPTIEPAGAGKGEMPSRRCTACEGGVSADKYSLFEEFSQSAIRRLGIEPAQDISFLKVWSEVEPFNAFIGPYWSLRAAMGPILETLILLDRLLFFQEQESLVEAFMLPIFDPALSPRNVAIIATKVNTEMIN